MNRPFLKSLVVVSFVAGLAGQAHAAERCWRVYRTVQTTAVPAGSNASAKAVANVTVNVEQPSMPGPAPVAANRVVYKEVQQTAQYDLSRPEVPSGARITLFANFLGQTPGCVTFNLAGTSTECEIIEWKPNSVTITLPRLGLLAPKNAEIQVIMPDGRIAKSFRILFVSQPDVVVHQETVPLPTPPAPAAEPAVYATPVNGGLVLHSGQ